MIISKIGFKSNTLPVVLQVFFVVILLILSLFCLIFDCLYFMILFLTLLICFKNVLSVFVGLILYFSLLQSTVKD